MPGRIDIIVGKLKPMMDKKMVKAERPADKMQSSDFVQEIDMDHEEMMYESIGEAILQAVKQHDASGLAHAICDLINIELDKEEMSDGESESDSEEY